MRLIIHLMTFLLFLRVLQCFPTKCLFHFIGRGHLGKPVSVYGNDSFEDYPSLFAILANSPLTVTVDDTALDKRKPRPAAYLVIIPLSHSTEFVVDRAENILRQLSKYSGVWFPSARMVMVLVEKEHVDYSLDKLAIAFNLIRSLWKYKVYDNVIFIAKESGEEGEAWTASPFHKENLCGKMIRHMDSTQCSTADQTMKKIILTPRKYLKDLSGCVFRVSTRDSPPFAFKMSDEYVGADVNFVRLFSQVTRASIEWQERPSPESGLSKSVVLAYYQLLSSGCIDLAIGGAVLRAEFDSNVDYLQPHGEHLLKIYVPDGNVISGWSSLYCMFSFGLWSMVLMASFVAGCFWYILETIRRKFSKGKRHPVGGEVFLFVHAILLEQSCWRTPHNSLSHRLLLGTLCLGFLLTSSLYKIFLQSYTVRPPMSPHVQTFDDLVDFNYSVVASDTNLKMLLKESNVSRLKRIKSWISRPEKSLKTLMDLNEKRNFAFLERDCFVEYLLRSGKFRIHALEDEAIDSLSVSLVMPKGSEYKELVSFFLARAIESGLYKKWMSDIVGEKPDDALEEPRPLGLNEFWAVFGLLIIGHLVALTTFLAELLVHRVTKECVRVESQRTVQRENKGRRFIWLN